mmetsp:Transcript_6785/g.15016  ORF Transcript_6785/g.15016 Transcript_6785/m.15016 type:complete len:105 (-) Transcript_6785:1169-1483(-)
MMSSKWCVSSSYQISLMYYEQIMYRRWLVIQHNSGAVGWRCSTLQAQPSTPMHVQAQAWQPACLQALHACTTCTLFKFVGCHACDNHLQVAGDSSFFCGCEPPI